MINIVELMSISEAGVNSIGKSIVKCPEEYKNLSMNECSLYFENQMLRHELEYRDIVDESVNMMLQDILDRQNGIVNEAAEETKKSGFREWCAKVRNWFINIFKSIGRFFRGLIDKLTKNSKNQKDINDTLDKNAKTTMDRLNALGEETAKEIEKKMKDNQCKITLNIIDGAVLKDENGIVSFRNAAFDTDRYMYRIDIDEFNGRTDRQYKIYGDAQNNKYSDDIPKWSDSLSDNKELQKALFTAFKFKKDPDTFTELITMLENKKSVEVAVLPYSASYLKTLKYFDDVCFKYISKESIGTEMKLDISTSFSFMNKKANEFLTEWEKYSKSVLNDMNAVLKSLETEEYTNDVYTRLQRYINALISVSSKKYSLITKIFNLIVSTSNMYINDALVMKSGILKFVNSAIKEEQSKKASSEESDEEKRRKEHINATTNSIKKSYTEMKKTSDEISKLDTDAMDKHNPGLRQELLDMLHDD